LGMNEDEYGRWLVSQAKLLEHITIVRRLFCSPRDEWGKWLKVDEHQMAYTALYVMMKTPGRLDIKVEKKVKEFVQERRINSPERMLEEFHEKGGEYHECVLALAENIRTLGLQNRTAAYIVQMTIICIIEGRSLDSYEEIRALNGGGEKIACVVMYEVFHVVSGIPVDTHMINSFRAIGWTKSKNGDVVARQVAMIVPSEYHGRLNETFAGLGQILQNKNDKNDDKSEDEKKRDEERRKELVAELVDVHEEDRDEFLPPIFALLEEYGINTQKTHVEC